MSHQWVAMLKNLRWIWNMNLRMTQRKALRNSNKKHHNIIYWPPWYWHCIFTKKMKINNQNIDCGSHGFHTLNSSCWQMEKQILISMMWSLLLILGLEEWRTQRGSSNFLQCKNCHCEKDDKSYLFLLRSTQTLYWPLLHLRTSPQYDMGLVLTQLFLQHSQGFLHKLYGLNCGKDSYSIQTYSYWSSSSQER